MIVLEAGKVGFDGDVDEGIKYLHYDGSDDEPDLEEEADEEIASDI